MERIGRVDLRSTFWSRRLEVLDDVAEVVGKGPEVFRTTTFRAPSCRSSSLSSVNARAPRVSSGTATITRSTAPVAQPSGRLGVDCAWFVTRHTRRDTRDDS